MWIATRNSRFNCRASVTEEFAAGVSNKEHAARREPVFPAFGESGLHCQEATEPAVARATRHDRFAFVQPIVTSGKTLKLQNDPWAHRGSPFEIDAEGDDTRDELIAFLDCVRTRD